MSFAVYNGLSDLLFRHGLFAGSQQSSFLRRWNDPGAGGENPGLAFQKNASRTLYRCQTKPISLKSRSWFHGRLLKECESVSAHKTNQSPTLLYPMPVLEKGLEILGLFASDPTGLSKSHVARRPGRTVSEIFRMLVCLEERGYISQSRDDEHFHLTLRPNQWCVTI